MNHKVGFLSTLAGFAIAVAATVFLVANALTS